MGPLPEPQETACLAIVHHANQYVIADSYGDRQGMTDILGLRGAASHAAGFLPLLRMHLEYGIPLNLHLSGTLIEALAWHCPQSFSFIKDLARAGLLEIVGSTFSQNVMPFFEDRLNLRQINDELALLRRHLAWDPARVKVFWVPERVWDTDKLAPVLRSPSLLNGGYRYVLLDDRLLFPWGERYDGSPRERFDKQRPRELEAYLPWEIAGSGGLVVLPISRDLRYAIPPATGADLQRLAGILRWLASSRHPHSLAVYGDDFEKAAGVGGWDPQHPERYERFLHFLRDQKWVRPVLISAWGAERAPAGVRSVERGTFFELAQTWKAGEDYRGWYEDPNCREHRAYLARSERALREAERVGADPALLDLGWKHFLHCCYETSWHQAYPPPEGPDGMPRLAGFTAALTSHARSSIMIAKAARWAVERDGEAHAETLDIDDDGLPELVLKNPQVLAVFSPRWGGRLSYLFDFTGRSGRMVVGNLSDDWNLQEDLHRYMDCPRNHPGALADVGHEHDRHEVALVDCAGRSADATLRNVENDSPLWGAEKRVRLAATDAHLSVSYELPPTVRRLSTEVCFSPDYARLLQQGSKGLSPLSGPRWRGWRNGGTRVWLRIDSRQSTLWDTPHQERSGHGLNLRVTSFSRSFGLELGVGSPSTSLAPRTSFIAEGATAASHAQEGRRVPAVAAADPRLMRRLLSRHFPTLSGVPAEVRECRIRVLKPHHDRLILQYDLQYDLGAGENGRGGPFERSLVGAWRKDERGEQIYEVMRALRSNGFDGTSGLSVPQPLGYFPRAQLVMMEKAGGNLLRQWIYNPRTDWPAVIRPVARYLAKLHGSGVRVSRRLTAKEESSAIHGWLADVAASEAPWIEHEKERIAALLGEILARQSQRDPGNVGLIHGDCHTENILVRGGEVTVIDWEHAAMADPALDLGFLLGQVEIQSDRYWWRRGQPSPLDAAALTRSLLDEYCRTAPRPSLTLLPVYQARTYVRHIVHTVRMKGKEDPSHVTRWLDRAADRLGWAGSRRMHADRRQRSRPTLPSEEGLTMPTEKLIAQQAAARDDFAGRIARITTPDFIAGPLLSALPEFQGRTLDPAACRAHVVQNDGTGPATLFYDVEGAGRVFAKLYRDASGQHAYQVLSTLWSDGFGPNSRYRVAQPLAFIPDLNLMLARAAPGKELAAATTDEELVAGAREAARWLLQLHRSPLRLGEPRYPMEVYHKLLHRLGKAAATRPEQVETLLEQADRLEETARKLRLQLVQAHGQFRHIHVFLADDAVTVIDLDRCRPGDPARDVGEYIHRMRTKRYKASGGKSRAEDATRTLLEVYSAELPDNLYNLPFYWGYHNLVSLWRFMKGTAPDHPDYARLVEFYLSEFETALGSRVM
jgi:aminoglycoside phosphotransferase (APT) family kinase protein